MMKVRKELQGVLSREKDMPCVKTEDGKVKLVYNLFDGLMGKKVRITVEESEEDRGEGEGEEPEEERGEEPEDGVEEDLKAERL